MKAVHNNKYLLVLAVVFILLFGLSQSGGRNNQSGSRRLKDISVFHKYSDYRTQGKNAAIFCSAWGNLELENGVIPLERRVRNGSKRVYRVNASGNCGIMFPLHGWGAFSLQQYHENGYIEFDVRGAAGGENFTVGLRSDTRNVVVNSNVSLASQNIQLTTAWQTVRIPLKAFTANNRPGFNINNILLIEILISSASQFYLSEMYIKSPDNEKQYPVIKVNQTGYELNHEKFALVSSFPGIYNLSANTEFNVINASGQVRFTGRLQAVSRNVDAVSGEIVFKADFSQFNEPGTYSIRITNPQMPDSFKFIIGTSVYNNLFIDSIKYFYLQRQGINIEQRHAGIFARRNLHPNDSRVKKYSQRNDPNAPVFDVSRGWYDAGDFGKYFPPAASAVTDLLLAYEFFPQLFLNNQLNIPESRNGSPDILDEVKWALDMMLKFEDGSSGGFYEVANYEGETIYIIDTNGVTGEGNTKSTNATSWAAGIFAHAYIVYKDIPVHRDFAARCLQAAVRAWSYLERNPNEHTWVSGAGRSYYYDTADTAKVKFLAAAALYRATGEEKYNRFVIDNYRRHNYQREFNAFHVVTIGDLGTGFIHYAMSSNPNPAVIRYFDERFRGFESAILNIYNSNVWPSGLVNWAYFWGSSKPIARIPVELYICNKLLNRDTSKSIELLRNSVHYILGINPLSFSFISGYGENSVKNIYSGIFSYNGIIEIPKGYLAGGANQYEAGFMSNFVSKCYIDIDREWTTNEHAIYWNAAMVLCLAAVIGTAN
ncbi:MAG: glycoside hydrolase family 9 protein [Treponema sp.]|nr:glycoside hydrolase family 9 protein [Treponema sp.]